MKRGAGFEPANKRSAGAPLRPLGHPRLSGRLFPSIFNLSVWEGRKNARTKEMIKTATIQVLHSATEAAGTPSAPAARAQAPLPSFLREHLMVVIEIDGYEQLEELFAVRIGFCRSCHGRTPEG